MSLLVRACVIWLLLLGAAVLNGAGREAVLRQMVGERTAHVVSSVVLSTFIFLLGWLTSSWLDLVSPREARAVGALWLGLTVAFEFLAGHFVFGTAWSALLADYDLTQGRLWVLVLVTTAITPSLVYRLTR